MSPYDIPVGYAHPHQQFAQQPQYAPFDGQQNLQSNGQTQSATSREEEADGKEENVSEQIYVEGVQITVPVAEEPEPQDVPKPIFQANPE